jgi:hypothetical protein
MKKRNKELSNTACSIKDDRHLDFDQLEQQKVQQRYHIEFEKYQEQINKTKQAKQDGQAA